MSIAVSLSHITIEFAQNLLLSDASAQVNFGDRIGIIGPNGAGKSTLLKAIAGQVIPTMGTINSAVLTVAMLEQQRLDTCLSGAEAFEVAFTQVLSESPDILLLDEPTNHLDPSRRKRLMRLLEGYYGTVLIASHDEQLLETTVDKLWVVDHKQLITFPGRFSEYWLWQEKRVEALQAQKEKLKNTKKSHHQQRMKAQEKSAKKAAQGKKAIQKRKWPTIQSKTKLARGQECSDKIAAELKNKAAALNDALSEIHLPELPIPRFSFEHEPNKHRSEILISDGTLKINEALLLEDINFYLRSGEHVGIFADNATGKTSFFKAIMGQPDVVRSGQWQVPPFDMIGWLDQHYALVDNASCPLEAIENRRPDWTPTECRRHLCDFLFSTTEQVMQPIKTLSGGEKARISLACIAAAAPPLLLLDEVTNNIDWWARQQIISVMKAYPGSLLLISHDAEFLKALSLDQVMTIKDKQLKTIELTLPLL